MAGIGVAANRLIGRDHELATLGSFLGEAAVDGATLLLTGEPGVGKTALLAATAELAASDGVAVRDVHVAGAIGVRPQREEGEAGADAERDLERRARGRRE